MTRGCRLRISALGAAAAALLAACTGGSMTQRRPSTGPTVATRAEPPATHAASPTRAPGRFTMAFAGDVHFAGRVGDRLDRDSGTVFGPAAAELGRADLTMVNLETAVTTGGEQQAKAFTFRAPPRAFDALRAAGVDVATMANNHGADFGSSGLRDSLAAEREHHFPVVGIGHDAAQAFAPYTSTLNGVRVAIFGADQVQDETTLRLFSAGPHSAGVANAYDHRLVAAVRRAKDAGYVVIVYLHWGIEYRTCPSSDQSDLAEALAGAGASAVVGAHAHVLQGAGWRDDGTYVAYGLGNYLWWRSFGNDQDDNGVLTLTFRQSTVVGARFAPAHLDDRGVPLPAAGSERHRIAAEWKADRGCTDLAGTPPR